MRRKYSPGRSPQAPFLGNPIDAHFTNMLFKEAPHGLASSILLLILATILFSMEYTLMESLIWSGSVLVIIVVRVFLIMMFRQDPLRQRTHMIWRNRFIIFTLLTGIGWGVGFMYFFSFEKNELLNVFIVFLGAGLTAGAIQSLGSVLLAYWVYLAPILAALAFRFFIHGEPIALVMGVIILIYAAFIAITATRFNHALKTSYRLNYENVSLVNTLTEAKNQSEAINAELKDEIRKAKTRDAELREAKDLAEQANRTKTEFLAVMSHELRTPLNGILGMFQVLQDTALDDEQLACLETAHTSAESLLYHIESMLEYSKLETGKILLRQDPFSLRRIVEEIMPHFERVAQERNNVINLEYDTSLPDGFIGDASRIKHIITQILGNAVKFTENGSISIIINCLEKDQNVTNIRLTIKDTGIGMDEKTQKLLFQPFTQADSSFTRSYEGIGLGMAIAYRLVSLMRGTISLVSRPREGTTFVVNLPLKISHRVNE